MGWVRRAEEIGRGFWRRWDWGAWDEMGLVYSTLEEEMVTRLTEYGTVQDSMLEAMGGQVDNWPRLGLDSTIETSHFPLQLYQVMPGPQPHSLRSIPSLPHCAFHAVPSSHGQDGGLSWAGVAIKTRVFTDFWPFTM